MNVWLPWHPLNELAEWGFHQDDGDVLLQKFRKARDTLALLAAVERVDYAGWKFLLTQYGGVTFGKEGEALFEEEVPVRFFLTIDPRGFDNKRFKDRLDYDLVELCGVAQQENVTPGFREALETIAAMDTNLQENQPGIEIQIPVCLMLRPESYVGDGDASGDEVARQLLAIAEAERLIDEQWEEYYRQHPKQPVAAHTYRCTFHPEPMVASFEALMSGSMQALGTLIRDNMTFSQIVLSVIFFDDLTADARRFRTCFGKFMTQVFDSTRRCRDVSDTRHFVSSEGMTERQVGAIYLSFEDSTSPVEVAATFSAMPFTQTTTKTTIRLQLTHDDEVPSSEWWKWLAYGLFSKRARTHSAIESLELVGLTLMSTEDIAGFVSIVSSDHPEEELFGTPRGLVDERIGTLKSGAPIRWEFNGRGQPMRNSKPLAFDEPVESVRTFSDDGVSEWVDVLVPGLGRCQVQRNSLVFDESTSLLSPPHDIRALLVEFNMSEFEPDYGGFLLFLQTIGTALHSLVLHDVGNMNLMDGDEFNQLGNLDGNWVLNSCPDLREVSLFTGTDMDISLNFDDYRNKCQSLPELNLMWGDDAQSLVESLADANNPLSTCIRRLRINTMFLDNLGEDPAPLMESLFSTLDVNHNLEYLELVGNSTYRQYQDTLRKYHLEPLHRVREPVSTECKAAFLSVTATTRRGHPKRSRTALTLPDLNQSVLRIIFSFAAVPVARQVYFQQKP